MRVRITSALALAALVAACLCDRPAWAEAASAGQGDPVAIDQAVPAARGVWVGLDSHLAHDRLIARSVFASAPGAPVERCVVVDRPHGVDRPLRMACPPQGPPPLA